MPKKGGSAMLFVLSLSILLWLLCAGALARKRGELNGGRKKARKEEKSARLSNPSRPDRLGSGGGKLAQLQRGRPSTGSGHAHRELVERQARREAR